MGCAGSKPETTGAVRYNFNLCVLLCSAEISNTVIGRRAYLYVHLHRIV